MTDWYILSRHLPAARRVALFIWLIRGDDDDRPAQHPRWSRWRNDRDPS
jgi:hypothetical protein